MSSPATLQDVLLRPDVWRGDRLAWADGTCISSGFSMLDAELPGGGWPRGGLIELLAEAAGIGEVSSLLPALRQVTHEGPIVIVAPPQCLHAPAWAAALPRACLWVVAASGENAAWSTELLLASGAAGAVLAWLPGVDARSLRRLQLASEGTRSLAFVFRLPAAARTASPALLRLALSGGRDGLTMRILKRRGPFCARSLSLPVARPLPWSRLPRTDAGPRYSFCDAGPLRAVQA
jgi:cell division inhibitor SulA/protein ImuA